MKRIYSKIFLSLVAIFAFALTINVYAEDSVHVHDPDTCGLKHIEVFVREGCGFCSKEKEFLKTLQDSSICHVVELDAFENKDLFESVTNTFNLTKTTPVTIVGNTIISGFSDSETTGKIIIDKLQSEKKFYTFEDAIKNQKEIHIFGRSWSSCDEKLGICSVEETSYDENPLSRVNIPFIGVKDLTKYSVPALSVILGFVDGFNPCAMWVLIMFLLALIQIGDRTKMFITAGIFIIAEAVMYGLILTVWLTTWNFVGFDKYVTIIVGIVAIGAGCFFLYEGIFSDGTCKVTNAEQRKKISAKIQDIAKSPLSWGFLVGILVLAFSVNIIEFACSIGIPQTFTEILHLSSISLTEQIWYVTIYIFFYMIDDIIVFIIALWSIDKIGITHKYAKISNILGGALMLLLGLILIFAPQLLVLN